jgi:hypothetical protein
VGAADRCARAVAGGLAVRARRRTGQELAHRREAEPHHAHVQVRDAHHGQHRRLRRDTKGAQAGTITTAGGDGTKPFTTNATGVATGLNAERVGSRTPAQLTSDAVAAVQATMSFARVLENGTMSAARGVDAAARNSAGIYSVVFHSDVSKCGLTATESAAGSEVGPVGVQLGPDHRTATVTTMNAQSPAAPADRAFSITALC